jgi:hypothetical protein
VRTLPLEPGTTATELGAPIVDYTIDLDGHTLLVEVS